MATHRSLNKLEFKAHMSIHNFKDFSHLDKQSNSVYTRDRLGKKHALADADGTVRVKKMRSRINLSMISILFVCSTACAFASENKPIAMKEGVKKAGPNCSISSEDPDSASTSDRMNRDDMKFGVPINSSTALGFNEDGDPSLSNRF